MEIRNQPQGGKRLKCKELTVDVKTEGVSFQWWIVAEEGGAVKLSGSPKCTVYECGLYFCVISSSRHVTSVSDIVEIEGAWFLISADLSR